uniref:CCHC-type domain-containing protein n=1 Tax=Cacopsylla melanoneura TaxID=428564 RepID=A0A8D8QH57_9HEMI
MGDSSDDEPPDLIPLDPPPLNNETTTTMDTTPQTTDVQQKTQQQRALLLYTADMKFDWYKLIVQAKQSIGSNASNGNFIRALHLSRVISEVSNKSEDITEVRRLNRNKFLVVCRTAKCANTIIQSTKIQEEFNAFIPSVYMQRSAIIRDVDLDVDDKMFMENVDSQNFKILRVQRLNRRSVIDGNVSYVPSRTLKLDFSGQDLPAFIYLWYTKIKCEPYMQRPVQCFSCYKFGHITKHCRSTKLCKTCFQPAADEHQCDTSVLKCTNCDGNHNANSKSCPEYERQQTIKDLMSTRNLCFPEACHLVPPLHVRMRLQTKNSFSVLENLNEEMPSHLNSKEYPRLRKIATHSRTIDKYVPPPLSTRTTKRKTVFTSLDASHQSGQKRKPVPAYFNAAQALSKPDNYYNDKEISAMFYKGCEANKQEKQQAYCFDNVTSQTSMFSNISSQVKDHYVTNSTISSNSQINPGGNQSSHKHRYINMSPHLG